MVLKDNNIFWVAYIKELFNLSIRRWWFYQHSFEIKKKFFDIFSYTLQSAECQRSFSSDNREHSLSPCCKKAIWCPHSWLKYYLDHFTVYDFFSSSNTPRVDTHSTQITSLGTYSVFCFWIFLVAIMILSTIPLIERWRSHLHY